MGKGRAEAPHRLDASGGPAAAGCRGSRRIRHCAGVRARSRGRVERESRPAGRAPPEPRGYANAIRDLLGIEVDVRTLLPADDADEHGFDNIADVLSVSPALLDRYMSAAKKVTRQALGRPLPGPAIQTYNVPRLLVQNARLSEDLPFGSRGGIAVRHAFPVDGEYSIKIKLQTNLYDYIRGLGRPHRLEVRVDGARVAQFVVGGEDHGSPAPAQLRGRDLRQPGLGKVRARRRRRTSRPASPPRPGRGSSA